MSGPSASKNEGDAGQTRTPETETDVRGAQVQKAKAAPGDADPQSVLAATQAQPDDAEADVASARRDAEAARQAYIQQSIIDRVGAAADTQISALFDGPAMPEADEVGDPSNLADVGEPQAAVAEDPFAKAD